jgi:membrane-bound lytic murein transglycosylase D
MKNKTKNAITSIMMLIVIALTNPLKSAEISEPWSSTTHKMVSDRLASLKLPMQFEVNDDLLSRIQNYTILGRNETEAMLGRSAMYHAIFDAQLQKEGLPEILRYLPVIESGMNAGVSSGAGAAGLWQLMPHTARNYGLTVNPLLDERMDVYKSTHAAVKMLSALYDQFGDWGLVLIAYNSGPSKVLSAVKLAGSKEYSKLSKYLPRETQVYVPAFVAAAYVSKFYAQHNLIPKSPVMAKEGFRSVRVHKQMSFEQIAKATQLSVGAISKLNPSFKQHQIPRSELGHLIILPAEGIGQLRKIMAEEIENQKDLFQTTYVISKDETLESIANLFKVKVEDLKKWNTLQNNELVINQELQLFLSKKSLINKV